jgi:hypothetical protein
MRYERTSNVSSRGEYKEIPYIIVFEGDFHYTVIAGGREICTSSSVSRAEDKFKAMVDTGFSLDE